MKTHPTAKAERSLSVQSRDLRGNAGQRARRAVSRRSETTDQGRGFFRCRHCAMEQHCAEKMNAYSAWSRRITATSTVVTAGNRASWNDRRCLADTLSPCLPQRSCAGASSAAGHRGLTDSDVVVPNLTVLPRRGSLHWLADPMLGSVNRKALRRLSVRQTGAQYPRKTSQREHVPMSAPKSQGATMPPMAVPAA